MPRFLKSCSHTGSLLFLVGVVGFCCPVFAAIHKPQKLKKPAMTQSRRKGLPCRAGDGEPVGVGAGVRAVTGHPHFGQATARLLISVPQSGHGMSGDAGSLP
jgi:hypothetical protein